MLREALDGSGVGIDHLRVVDGPSGTAVILVQPSGENSILIVGEAGADMPLGSSIFPRTRLPPSDASSCPRFDTLMRCVGVSRWCQHCEVGVCRPDTAGAACDSAKYADACASICKTCAATALCSCSSCRKLARSSCNGRFQRMSTCKLPRYLDGHAIARSCQRCMHRRQCCAYVTTELDHEVLAHCS